MSKLSTLSNHFSISRNGPTLAIILIGLAATACLAYMAGYYDGYHAGAVIYVGGQP